MRLQKYVLVLVIGTISHTAFAYSMGTLKDLAKFPSLLKAMNYSYRSPVIFHDFRSTKHFLVAKLDDSNTPIPTDSNLSKSGDSSQTKPPNKEEETKIDQLIDQLGSPKYRKREEAFKSLIKIGLPAKSALLKRQKDSNLEIASRCKRLLPAILSKDLQIRIDALLSDKEWKNKHDIPGLDRYIKIVGNTPESRAMFIELLNTHRKLFEISELNPKDLTDTYAERATEMTQSVFNNRGGLKQPTENDFRALFFFGQNEECAKAIASIQLFGNLMYQPVFQNMFDNSTKGKISLKLFIPWMEFNMSSNEQANIIQPCMNLIQNRKIKEASPILEKVVKNNKQNQFVRAQAISALSQLEGKSSIPVLESLYSEKTVIQSVNFGKMSTVQINDVALAAVIHLNGKNVKDFGFEFAQGNNTAQYYTLGFENDEKRNAAFKKWKTYKDGGMKEIPKDPAPKKDSNPKKDQAPKKDSNPKKDPAPKSDSNPKKDSPPKKKMEGAPSPKLVPLKK